ncbi:unnamed protein product [Enterobius vermicularis]|uniref:RNA polymerase-associated protein LEO1 n=1 Tax=Enterobius vermicularis TaxID=51028 RepID=A0A0N4VG77_ENTVE|nr:unnamed protein product [Enterobius vermicularis]
MAQYSTGSTSSSDDSSDDDASRPVPEGSPQTDGSQRSKDGRTETSSDSDDTENDEVQKEEEQNSDRSSSEESGTDGRQQGSLSEPANDSKFTLGSSEDGSRSPPSERQPPSHEDSPASVKHSEGRRGRAQISSDEDEDEAVTGDMGGHSASKKSEGQELNDIDLSDSENENQEESKEMTEDDIVGPRLYADPDAQEDEQEVRPPTIVEVNTARIDPSFTFSGLYFVKLPNFLSVDSRPFDQEHYEDEIDEDEYLDEEGRGRLKLKVENTLRWRYKLDEEGNLAKQSNAKIIRWSDGTMSLKLGNELFDVQCQLMQRDNHLFMRQGAGLQGHAVFSKKLVFRPFSTDSVTHRKVTLSMADRTNKSQKVKVLNNVGQDPEAQKAEMVRKEEERLRAQNRREAQQRRNRMRPSLRTGLSANYLEGGKGEEGIASIKRSYRAAAFDEAPLIGRSDSEESDSQRLHDAQKDSDESDSDQERRNQRKKKVIIEDDED